MSRPRKPFGATHPGRLPATMMKVLAAEMSDPHRLRKGKQYARDGSVLDIEVEPGIVTCEVQGSRPTPYLASIEVTSGDGMPLRRDVATRCTCPDDENFEGHSCKHAIAAMFCFSDELLLEPELLDLWRGRENRSSSDDEATRDGADGPPSRRPLRHLRLVGAEDRGAEDRGAEAATGDDPDLRPHTDRLVDLLASPTGAPLPLIPELERLDPLLPRDDRLARVLRDAVASAHVDWD
jgi:hypothetical protein